MEFYTLDLNFHTSDVIATYAFKSDDGIILIDPGPHSTHDHLVQALKNAELAPEEVNHVLLTHIHFDHAGDAWAWAKQGAQVYVHPAGYKHMLDPERLWNSAAQIYGDQMEALWGKMEQIDDQLLHQPEDRQTLNIGGLSFGCHYTPGHAKHHIAYAIEDMVFSGDVAGVRIKTGPAQPPTPPPDIDLEAWDESIARLREIAPKTVYPTHFGEVGNVETHLEQLQTSLHQWAQWIKQRMDAGESTGEMMQPFTEMVHQQLQDADCDEALIEKYNWANPAFMQVAGLVRYWKKKV